MNIFLDIATLPFFILGLQYIYTHTHKDEDEDDNKNHNHKDKKRKNIIFLVLCFFGINATIRTIVQLIVQLMKLSGLPQCVTNIPIY